MNSSIAWRVLYSQVYTTGLTTNKVLWMGSWILCTGNKSAKKSHLCAVFISSVAEERL